jgi:hypothetical protein
MLSLVALDLKVSDSSKLNLKITPKHIIKIQFIKRI